MSDHTPESGGRKVGAFDIRFVIAALIGVYGVVLLLLGLFNATDAELERADGFNVNLWAGIGMMAFAAGFVAWGRLRPVVVPASGSDDAASAEANHDAGSETPPR